MRPERVVGPSAGTGFDASHKEENNVMRKITLLTAAVVALGAFAVPVGTALADNNPAIVIMIENNGYLQPNGSVNVTIDYSCLPGFGSGPAGAMTGTLEQTQAFGQSSQTVTCDDHTHTTVMNFAPGPFTRGVAAASVTIVNGANQSATQNAEVTVQ